MHWSKPEVRGLKHTGAKLLVFTADPNGDPTELVFSSETIEESRLISEAVLTALESRQPKES